MQCVLTSLALSQSLNSCHMSTSDGQLWHLLMGQAESLLDEIGPSEKEEGTTFGACSHAPLDLQLVMENFILEQLPLRDLFIKHPEYRSLLNDDVQQGMHELQALYEQSCSELSGSAEVKQMALSAVQGLLRRDFIALLRACADALLDTLQAEQSKTNPSAHVILQTAYSHSAYPTPAERDRLARACGMTSKQVTTWVRTDLFHKSASVNHILQFANARQRGLTPAESKRKRRAKPYETPRKISSTSTLSSMPSLSSSTSSDNSPSPPSTLSPALSRSATSNSSLASSACMPLDLSAFDNLSQKPVDSTFDSGFISSFLAQHNTLHSQVQLVNEPQQLLPPFQLDQPMDFQLQTQAQPFNTDSWLQQNAHPQPATSTNFDLTWLPAASTSSLSQAAAPPTFDFTELLSMPLADEAVPPTAPASAPEHDNAMDITDTFWQDIMQSLGSQPQTQAPTTDSLPLQDFSSNVSFASLPAQATTDPCGYFDSLFKNSLATDLPAFDFSQP